MIPFCGKNNGMKFAKGNKSSNVNREVFSLDQLLLVIYLCIKRGAKCYSQVLLLSGSFGSVTAVHCEIYLYLKPFCVLNFFRFCNLVINLSWVIAGSGEK